MINVNHLRGVTLTAILQHHAVRDYHPDRATMGVPAMSAPVLLFINLHFPFSLALAHRAFAALRAMSLRRLADSF
jgi:hypothetical protein